MGNEENFIYHINVCSAANGSSRVVGRDRNSIYLECPDSSGFVDTSFRRGVKSVLDLVHRCAGILGESCDGREIDRLKGLFPEASNEYSRENQS